MDKTKIARIIFMIGIIFASLILTWKFSSNVIAYDSTIPKSSTSVEIGYTAGDYQLKNNTGIYCVDHGNGLSANKYSLAKKIVISGNTATGYTGSNSTADYTWTCIENGALAYILGHYTGDETSWAHGTGYWYGVGISNRQRALWKYWNGWCTNSNNQIIADYNKESDYDYLPYTASGNGNYNSNYQASDDEVDGGETYDSDGNELATQLCSYAENYASGASYGYGYTGNLESGIAKISCSTKSITPEYSSGLIGPIRVKCNNMTNSDDEYVAGWTSIYSITGNNGVELQACNEDGSSYTGDTFDGKTYTGLQEFYLKVTSGSIYDLTEITISAKNETTLTLELHIWQSDLSKQRLISVYTGETTSTDSVTITVTQSTGNLEIIKKDPETGASVDIEFILTANDPTTGGSWWLGGSAGNWVLYSSGNHGQNATHFTTKNGTCTIENLPTYLEYSIYEIGYIGDSEGEYFLSDQDGYSASYTVGGTKIDYSYTYCPAENSNTVDEAGNKIEYVLLTSEYRYEKLGISANTTTSYTFYNTSATGDLTITKMNEYGTVGLPGMEFKVQVFDSNYNSVGWLSGSDNNWTYKTDESEATVFKMGEKEYIKTLKGLRINYRYKIWETTTPEGYVLSAQIGYDESRNAADITSTQASRGEYIELTEGRGKTTYSIVRNRKIYTDIQIIKTDAENTSVKIEGMGFTIYNKTNGKWLCWDDDDDNGETTGTDRTHTNVKVGQTTSESEASIFYTDSSGQISIEHIDISDDPTASFKVTEADSKNLYYQTDTSKTDEETAIAYAALIREGSDIVTRTEGEYVVFEFDNAKAYSLTLYKKDYDMPNEDVTAYFYIKYNIPSGETNSVGHTNDGLWLTSDGEYVDDDDKEAENSKAKIEVSSSGITISDIQRGTYEIYEYQAPEGYDLTQQYKYNSSTGYVECGTVTVGDSSSGTDVSNYLNKTDKDSLYSYIEKNEYKSPTMTIYNRKWVASLKGLVWVDNAAGKLNDHNYTYDSGEELLKDIYVELYTIHGLTTYDLYTSTTTDENGKYEFEFYRQVLYWDLCDYYVSFTYNNETYIVVDPFVGDDDSINSKAQEYSMTQDELDDTNLLDGVPEDDEESEKQGNSYPGYAITNSETTSLTDDGCLANYYNSSNYKIEAINLGLLIKNDPEYTVEETLAYAYITINGFSYIYYYDKPTDTTTYSGDDYDYQIGTVLKEMKDGRSYKEANGVSVYSSDIASTIGTEKMKLYLVYSIYVENVEELYDEDVYCEQKLFLTSLTNEYDTNRLKLNNSENVDNSQYIGSDQFDMWSDTSTGTASYALFDSGEANHDSNNVYINGIDSKTAIKTYIQFEVTETALYNLIYDQDTILKWNNNSASEAIATGFHEYLRTDNLWRDDLSTKEYASDTKKYPRDVEYEEKNTAGDLYYIHKSEEKEETSGAMYVLLQLAETDRTISGTVYEDDAEEDTNEDTYVGNGKIDSTESNKAKDVIVELLEAVTEDTNDDGTIDMNDLGDTNGDGKINQNDLVQATLYTTKKGSYPAKAETDENGKYSFEGVVPGYYYIRYTYGDGTQTIVDTNGNVIDYLTSFDYKSTIINTEAESETKGEGGAGSILQDAMDDSWSWTNDNSVKLQTDNESSLKDYYKKGDKTTNETAMKLLEWYKYLDNTIDFNTAVDDLNLKDLYNDYTYTEAGIYDGEPQEDKSNLIVRYDYDSDGNITQMVDVATGNAIATYTYDTSTGDVTVTYNYAEENSYPLTIQSYTPETAISVENTKLNYTDNGNEHVSIYDKFDLGVVKQPETDTKITKTIVDVDVTLQIGTTVISNLDSKYVSEIEKQYYKVEMEESEIYGSKFEIKYQIEVENTSQYDYIETDTDEYGTYYIYGKRTSSAEAKTIKINEVVDDVDKKFDVTDLVGTEITQTKTTSSGTETDSIQISRYDEKTTTTVGENSTKTTSSITFEGWLPIAKSESITITYKVGTTLSSTDDTVFKNCARITSLSLNNLTTLTSGYVWGERSKTVIAIIPATGGDMRNVLYIGGAIALLAIAFGLVLIKKKVI